MSRHNIINFPMKGTHRTVLLVILFIAGKAEAQQLNLSRLFYPNATLRADYFVPSSSPSGREYGLARTSFFGMTPLQSEVNVGYSLRKKFDIKAVHTVMYGQFTQLQPALAGVRVPDNGYKTAALGVIRLQASLKDRLWVYGGGLGVTESNETFFTPQPHLWGGAARLRVFGLQTQLMYGSILVFNQKLRVVPILGFNKRFARNWRATAILPFTADVNYRVSKFFNVDFLAGINGYSGGFKIQGPDEKLVRRANYQHIKVGAAANLHLFTVVNVSAEAGMTGFRTLRTFNSAGETLSSVSPGPAPYVGVSFRYITSRSKISSRFTGKMGIGGAGMNW